MTTESQLSSLPQAPSLALSAGLQFFSGSLRRGMGILPMGPLGVSPKASQLILKKPIR